MANLVIKSNTANRTFNVQQKSFKLPFKDDRIELLITPKKSYLIDKKDFNTGVLSAKISKVEFYNLGKKVVATIFMRGKITSNKNVILDVPIYGKSTVKKDIFSITKTISKLGNIITNESSPYPRSIQDEKTSYIINNDLGKKTLAFSQTFIVMDGFNFSKRPTYNIDGNSTRYTVVTHVKKNSKKKITNITFDFYYTSPSNLTTSKDTIISFSANANDPSPKVSEAIASNVRENRIYSVNQGLDPGPLGGQKRMVVKGIPGSTFSFLVSNSSGDIYDMDNGCFTKTGTTIKGVIPRANNGKPYGESIIRINIPKTSATQSISTSFIQDEDPVVKSIKMETAIAKAIEKGENPATAALGQVSSTTDKTVETTSLTAPQLEFLITMGDFLGQKVKIVSSGVTTSSTQVYLGNEGRETLKVTTPGVYNFSFTLRADGGLTQIIRDPLFVMPTAETDNFYVDGGSPTTANKLAKLGSDGSTSIVTDWNWGTVRENADIQIKLLVSGYGESISSADVTATGAGSPTTLYSYSEIVIKGQINVLNVGKLNDTVSLNLANFLAKT